VNRLTDKGGWMRQRPEDLGEAKELRNTISKWRDEAKL
jgi:hypothetical protein